jgi:hypothetical protein
MTNPLSIRFGITMRASIAFVNQFKANVRDEFLVNREAGHK